MVPRKSGSFLRNNTSTMLHKSHTETVWHDNIHRKWNIQLLNNLEECLVKFITITKQLTYLQQATHTANQNHKSCTF